MKNIYETPNVELMHLSSDVITTSASDPWGADKSWDFSKYVTDPASLLELN